MMFTASSFFYFCYPKRMSVQGFTLPSFAKINLYLRVLGKRDDGFHELCTVFQTVSLFDEISFSNSDKVELTCSNPLIPIDGRNLIIRAANLLLDKFQVKKGAEIHLEKRIPAPGGLGGGSSNAVIAMLGLAKLWEIDISADDLQFISENLGADVSFFLTGGTAIGTGRGTKIEAAKNVAEEHILIVAPEVDVSTCKAFGLLGAPRLTKSEAKSILQICRSEAMELNLRQSGLKNDFENAVFKIEPEIGRVKKKLFDLDAKHALMSGSGASVFGVFESEMRLRLAVEALKVEETWRVFPVKTVSREEYLRSLNLVEEFLR